MLSVGMMSTGISLCSPYRVSEALSSKEAIFHGRGAPVYDDEDEEAGLSEVDAALMEALVAVGLLSVHGDIDNYRERAADGFRNLALLMEDESPFIGVARMAVDMVDNYAEGLSLEAQEPYFEKCREFAQRFMADEPTPALRLVEDDEDE